MSEILVVIEWSRFQHYTDRDPVWIKLYRDILTSEAWVVGTDLSRLVQIAIMLLAARYHNKTPYRFDLIKKVASLGCSEPQFRGAIKHLQSVRFLQVMVQDASDALADGYHCAMPEKRREEKRREEQEDASTPLASVEGLDPEAWRRWTEYRALIGKAIKPVSQLAAMKKLAAFGARQAEAVENSIAENYQGLFLPKPNGHSKVSPWE